MAENVDAFISYSTKTDNKIAGILRSSLERLCLHWYQRSHRKIYLDKTSLPVVSNLPEALRDVIRSAKSLVLLASPESADSRYVSLETSSWLDCAGDNTNRLFIVLTGGEIVCQDGTIDWQRTSALSPVAFQGSASQEPRYVDLRWLKTGWRRYALEVPFFPWLMVPHFRDCVADIVAGIYGRKKEELLRIEAKQRRVVNMTLGNL